MDQSIIASKAARRTIAAAWHTSPVRGDRNGSRRVVNVALVVAALAVLAGCASGSPRASSDASPTKAAADDRVATRVGLPSVEVLDVATSQMVQLASLLPSKRPLLVWFWAPH
jgi:hypothetical protein